MDMPERSLEVLHLLEPNLEFAVGQKTAHPKDGLFLYGPFEKPKKTKEIRIGVVGTPDGIGYFRKWSVQIKRRVDVPPPGKAEKKDRLHLTNFPGIEEAFGISFNDNELVTCAIELKAIDAACPFHYSSLIAALKVLHAMKRYLRWLRPMLPRKPRT